VVGIRDLSATARVSVASVVRLLIFSALRLSYFVGYAPRQAFGTEALAACEIASASRYVDVACDFTESACHALHSRDWRWPRGRYRDDASAMRPEDIVVELRAGGATRRADLGELPGHF